MRAERKSLRQVEALLWNGFEDFVVDGDLLSFADHAGIDLRGLEGEQIWDKFKAHYTQGGQIDMDRFLNDFTTWGPIASRIVELLLERNGGKVVA